VESISHRVNFLKGILHNPRRLRQRTCFLGCQRLEYFQLYAFEIAKYKSDSPGEPVRVRIPRRVEIADGNINTQRISACFTVAPCIALGPLIAVYIREPSCLGVFFQVAVSLSQLKAERFFVRKRCIRVSCCKQKRKLFADGKRPWDKNSVGLTISCVFTLAVAVHPEVELSQGEHLASGVE
jgi:hypothetical protein